jgi:predicted YcjX-like family ATPase
VHNLIHGGRLPLLTAYARGRVARAYLEPQPDDTLPRFAYEDHVAALTSPERYWPEGTKRLSQLRLTIEYWGESLFSSDGVARRLSIDIVDYPGEWLLDLPLLTLSYAEWSAATVAASRKPPRRELAGHWHAHLSGLDANAPRDELKALKAADLFTSYLARCRADDVSLSSLPPGRFLMPGDLAGSPLLTFAPLDIASDHTAASGSLADLMERRYDAYVRHVVKPFFFRHFARLDRQIVLVDVLSAINAGAAAIADLGAALTNVLACFRQGANSFASRLFGRRVDRILFAATKADLVHHTSHDKLEAILRRITREAAGRASFRGARIDVAALAAIRATREATVRQKGEELACIAGYPAAGETIDGQTFDGETEAAVFPGDLPTDPDVALSGKLEGKVRFIRFRPPRLKAAGQPGHEASFPHTRLDRALEFLIGDRLA